MNIAETITVFLMDGDANGRIKASIENWTGLGYKIPRDKLDECASISYLNQSSVYFLFGSSRKSKNPVYIGQAVSRKNGKGILARLKEHAANPDKDYWTDAIVFTTKDNSFGPTELSYLENLFCNMAIAADRYEVKNANDPNSGNITEEKESSLKRFATYAELILGVFGYKVFTPLLAYEKKQSASNTSAPPKKTQNPTPSKLDASILLSGGKPSAKYMKKWIVDTGYVEGEFKFTIAKINKNEQCFWANPPIDSIDSLWLLVLNDIRKRNVHIFKIPAGAISRDQIKLRKKNGIEDACMDVKIDTNSGGFLCTASGIDFQPWYIETLNY